MPDKEALFFDNTRVSSYFTCPRSYYFRHVRGWRRDGTSTALAFGGAMHEAMEVLWGKVNELSPAELLTASMQAFNKKWAEEGFSTDEINMDEKRNPGLAAEILHAYIEKYLAHLKGIQVLAIEAPFVVPLFTDDDHEVNYIGRFDKVWRDKKNVFVGEHKTTSLYRKEGIFAKEWQESFAPNNQVEGYLYAAQAIWGKECKGVFVDGIMVHKTVRAFTRISVRRMTAALDAWIWETSYWINEILDNMTQLGNMDDPFMKAFPKRTEHCQGKYGLCGYLPICKYADPNPQRVVAPPENFIEEIWDPFEHNVDDENEVLIVGSGAKNG